MECSIPVCKICAIKNHKKHDLSEIKEYLEGINAEVNIDVETKIKKLQSNIIEIHQGTHTYQADVQKAIQAIREEGRHLKEMIDKKVEGLIITLKEKDTRNVKTLQSVGNELKTALDKAKEQQKFYQDTQGIKDTTKLLQKLKQIKSQIDQIEEIQIPIMPSVKYAKKTVAEGEIGKLFGELTFGETVKKEENPKPKENVRVTRTAKQYRYRCHNCE
ncbi:uncharacterized protein LOC143043850 [Mytilus galloprovincialis]|uniref:uncharacterized protein LOC143043850 n=1 Tax=Mytilus galloprovincialis TaxID=29158 RepID=UPI003F7B6EDB